MQEKCSLKGCNRHIYVKKHKLCVTHYMRYLRKGDPGQGKIRKKIPLPVYKSEEAKKAAIE